MGCVQGPSRRATARARSGRLRGRREQRANPTSLTGQSLHTHTDTERRHAWDTLTCREGRRGRKGHGGGQLKREAVGRGVETPGGRIQSQNKKKRWRMESKNETKDCQLNTGERVEGLTPAHHTTCSTHRGKVLSAPCPSRGSHLP